MQLVCNTAETMKTISVSVSSDDYEAFRRAAREQGRPIAQLIRESMAVYRAEHLEKRPRLEDLPVLAGHQPIGDLPGRAEIYGEIFAERREGSE